jgi:hypothetical protein
LHYKRGTDTSIQQRFNNALIIIQKGINCSRAQELRQFSSGGWLACIFFLALSHLFLLQSKG